MGTIVLIVIAFVVIDLIAVAFVVWWRIFRRPRSRSQSGGPWAAGGFVIGGPDDHSPGGSHGDAGSCGGGSGCGGGGCGGGD